MDEGSFEKLGKGRRPGLISEFLAYLRESRKWWLFPNLLALLVLGMVFLVGTGAAPFIGTLFQCRSK